MSRRDRRCFLRTVPETVLQILIDARHWLAAVALGLFTGV
jgi:hypothetical protein